MSAENNAGGRNEALRAMCGGGGTRRVHDDNSRRLDPEVKRQVQTSLVEDSERRSWRDGVMDGSRTLK